MRLWLLSHSTSKSDAHPSLLAQTLPTRDPYVLFLLLSRCFLPCHSWPLKTLQISLLLRRPLRPRWYFCSLPYGQSCRMGRLRSNRRHVPDCPLIIDMLSKTNKLQQSRLSIWRKSAWLQQGIDGSVNVPQLKSRMLTSGNGEAQAREIWISYVTWSQASEPSPSWATVGSFLPLDGQSLDRLLSDCSGSCLKSHGRTSICKDLLST